MCIRDRLRTSTSAIEGCSSIIDLTFNPLTLNNFTLGKGKFSSARKFKLKISIIELYGSKARPEQFL